MKTGVVGGGGSEKNILHEKGVGEKKTHDRPNFSPGTTESLPMR